MSFTNALKALNGFKRRRVIRDYAVIGAVAATAYMEPMFTEDLDVIVLVDTDDDYLAAFQSIANESDGQEGMHQVLGGVPVQLFPSTTMPLYRDTVEQARQVRIGSLKAKIATPEHLILLYLLAFRERDQFRVRTLLRGVDEERLTGLLERFDDAENILASRLQNLRRTSVPRETEMASPTGPDELCPQT
jgi:predicted nucleotidyltransferase